MLEQRATYDKGYPELWRLCYSCVYHEPSDSNGEYYSPKSVSWDLAEVAIAYYDYRETGKSSRSLSDYPWTSEMPNRRVFPLSNQS
jgi:hypothetical protein